MRRGARKYSYVGPATEATERALRGAVQVVQSALRSGDRAGIVTLGGGRPRWLGAEIGRRQFYRVLDTLLGAGDEFETTTGTLAPRAALPPGAIVIGFSTMLDTEFALSLIDLRKRGHTVVAPPKVVRRKVVDNRRQGRRQRGLAEAEYHHRQDESRQRHPAVACETKDQRK